MMCEDFNISHILSRIEKVLTEKAADIKPKKKKDNV